MSSEQQRTFQIETTASEEQQSYRRRLIELFERSPLPIDERLFNIGMYTRSSVLVKYLVLNDIYQRVKHLPGQFLEFGTWWGQNLIMLENLRAINEPFNKQRTIVGFDTFNGYSGFSDKDRPSEVWAERSYSTGTSYVDYLRELLECHEGSNVLGQVRGMHRLVVGDVEETAPQYFSDHPEALVAFAYFDMGLYKPTRAALNAIKPHLLSGSVILLDELTWAESPGEAIAFKEVFDRGEVLVEKCALYPSKALVTMR
ncbi:MULTISPECIES: class I SAM-dependent methyltransferase [unclassified Bradyrhizobium]|uniref:class I SAM-dependent methyltransferase n=1 Tax=unclassified Bradyrhizobium TaxID=2631580 RepID=UPI0028E59145|nr:MULTISPECIES: class I SAM-dependent methyltransferase [unclassified Bradyrhizobium]